MRSSIRLLAVLGAAGAGAQTLPLVAPPGTLACPQVHVFAARETLAGPGFGSAEALVNLVAAAFVNSTAEAINYPAAGGDDYANSVSDGIVAVLGQMQVFANLCPDTILVAHGYSQGGQVFDDVFCGGPDGTSLEASSRLLPDNIAAKVAAVIMMGNPRHVAGLPYNVGNATEPGFAARPAGFSCGEFDDRIQLYCDSPDPFCATGDDAEFHQGYGIRNGPAALEFIQRKVLVN